MGATMSSQPRTEAQSRTGSDVVDQAMRSDLRARRRLRRRDLALSIGTPVVLLAAWQAAASGGLIDARLFPAPTTIAARAGEMVVSGELWTHLSATLFRFASGFGIGAVVGIAAGLLMGVSRVLNAAFGPLFSALYALPKIAILPLLLLIFGLSEVPRVIAVAFTVFFVLQINTLSGVRQIDARTQEAATAYGAVGWKRIVYVILPGSLPSVFTGLRVAAGLGVVVVTAVEFVASNSGLGYLIWNSWQLFQAEKMYVGLLVVALLGATVTFLLSLLEQLALPWRRSGPRRGRSRRATSPATDNTTGTHS